MFELADMYLWKENWSLPEGFESKKEFKICLAENDYVLITSTHHSKKNGWHFDVLQYAGSGKIGKKLHCKLENNIGSSFVECIKQILASKQ
jgi:hypothetical protein